MFDDWLSNLFCLLALLGVIYLACPNPFKKLWNGFNKLLDDYGAEKTWVKIAFIIAIVGVLFSLFLSPLYLNCIVWLQFLFRPDFIDLSSQLSINDYLQRLKEYQTAILTISGGLIALVGLLITQRRLDHNRAEHRTQQFKDAVELLGHPEMDVRQGAIYALQGLMRDAPEQYGVTICNLLASFVNHRASLIPKYEEKNQLYLSISEKIDSGYTNIETIQQRLAVEELNKIEKNTSVLKQMQKEQDEKFKEVLDFIVKNRPYSDVITALQVLAERQVSEEQENQIDFNFPKIDWGYLDISNYSFNIVDVYFGKYEWRRKKKSQKNSLNSSITNADLKNIDTESSVFKLAKFIKSELKNMNLISCNFIHTIFSESILESVNLSYSALSGSKSEGCTFSNCIYHCIQGADIVYSKSRIFDCIFEKSYLIRSQMNGCVFTNCYFSFCLFPDSSFNETTFENCKFEYCDLTFVDFSNAKLKQSKFENFNRADVSSNELTYRMLRELSFWDAETIFPNRKKYKFINPLERPIGWVTSGWWPEEITDDTDNNEASS